VNLATRCFTLVFRKEFVADIVILGCFIFVFGWLGAALIWLARV
jgi:hypothetical protein